MQTEQSKIFKESAFNFLLVWRYQTDRLSVFAQKVLNAIVCFASHNRNNFAAAAAKLFRAKGPILGLYGVQLHFCKGLNAAETMQANIL